MVYTVSITSQGQISIPTVIRKMIGLSLYDKVLLTVSGGKVIIEPRKDLLDMRGILKTNKRPLSAVEIHKRFAEECSKR